MLSLSSRPAWVNVPDWSDMDGPQAESSIARPFHREGLGAETSDVVREPRGVADRGQGNPGKPVGAVVAAANVLRTLHASERPLNASEVARAAGLHRGTAYNILRTLQAEGFVGYDEATRKIGRAHV